MIAFGQTIEDPSGRGRPCVVVNVRRWRKLEAVLVQTQIMLSHPDAVQRRYIALGFWDGKPLFSQFGGWSESDSHKRQNEDLQRWIDRLESGETVDERMR